MEKVESVANKLSTNGKRSFADMIPAEECLPKKMKTSFEMPGPHNTSMQAVASIWNQSTFEPSAWANMQPELRVHGDIAPDHHWIISRNASTSPQYFVTRDPGDGLTYVMPNSVSTSSQAAAVPWFMCLPYQSNQQTQSL